MTVLTTTNRTKIYINMYLNIPSIDLSMFKNKFQSCKKLIFAIRNIPCHNEPEFAQKFRIREWKWNTRYWMAIILYRKFLSSNSIPHGLQLWIFFCIFLLLQVLIIRINVKMVFVINVLIQSVGLIVVIITIVRHHCVPFLCETVK